MIDSLLNLLFRCSHRRLTRPMSPITKAGQPHSKSYVVCLECGRQFEYDLDKMRMGKAIDRSDEACVVPKRTSTPASKKAKFALFTALPAAVVVGAAVLTSKKPNPKTGGADTKAAEEPGRKDTDPA